MWFHLCDSREKTKLEGQKTVQFLLWMAGEEHKGTFLGDGNVLACSGSYLKYTFVKTHKNVHLKRINFIICKLYLNKPDLKLKKKNYSSASLLVKFSNWLARPLLLWPPLPPHTDPGSLHSLLKHPYITLIFHCPLLPQRRPSINYCWMNDCLYLTLWNALWEATPNWLCFPNKSNIMACLCDFGQVT